MLRSHVSGPFWLGLPKRFCVNHFRKRDEKVVLVDENEIEHDTKYLYENRNGLSGGWRGFAISHKLAENDVLVFELIDIQPCKFKVISCPHSFRFCW
ncbi:B3 domain-containing protein os06g0194400 [Phtheirospermum japonicum]|uniref:B3 domain-containing protein os06g0194400 n=1 Tax=Phtheirospermum japonicum TaxID=374723 RepID=A0A830BUJ7_9LAMI|nr:B3 domain-containing protein os06g0194400 [Phtheirospermum japonicum]